MTSVHATELVLFHTLLQLVIIVLAARAGGALAQRCGQARVVGEIVVGIALGPSLFGLAAPQLHAWIFASGGAEPLTILSQIGLLLLMFQVGLEFDFGHLRERRNRRVVAAVSAAGLAAPFALGLAFAAVVPQAYVVTPDRLAFALFVATAFSITAMPVLGRILLEFGLERSALGVTVISCAAINDVAGWLLLALVTALAESALAPAGFALRVAGVLAFGALAWWGLRPPLERLVQRRMAADGMLTPGLMAALLAVVFAAGMATYQLGIFAIFGGFMAGVLLHRERAFVRAWHASVGSFVGVFFVPIFFTYTGLRTDLGSLATPQAWLWCAALIALATLGKFGACWLAARAAGMDAASARIVGVLMNTRGLMELVILNVGYDLGVIGREMFTMLVAMAIVSTVATSPALRRWLAESQQGAHQRSVSA